ncbi:unnamed protein product [Dracunculus medinensis]|uniref:DUF19 domain-containing protein n=1 Tax=Dracunculus medinensis TaxID=318479 RepID=A0A0N4UK78_DRAME|nr:unnamed protein product [Dracunculus medinensis]
MIDNDIDNRDLKCSSITEKKIQPMLNYAEELQKETGTLQFAIQGSHIFKKLCDIYLEFKDCTQMVICKSRSIEAIDASYEYMCGSGYKLFEKHADCFAEVELRKDYIKCKENAGNSIKNAKIGKNSDNHDYFEKLCSVMDSYLRCSRPIINRHCSAEAWKLVSTVTMDSLRVTMPNCDMHNALL